MRTAHGCPDDVPALRCAARLGLVLRDVQLEPKVDGEGMTTPAREQVESADGVNFLSWQELIDEVRRLRAILTAVRTCEEPNGPCRLCAHCVTLLYVAAQPAPTLIPPRYTELPWRRGGGS